MIVTKFACPCGFQSEGQGDAPKCSRCDGQMHSWGTRETATRSNIMQGESADKRTETGGY